MLIRMGEKIHISYRMLYEKSVRRHFIGEVIANEGTNCKLEGYVFIFDSSANMFSRKPELRITIIDLAESGYIVNIIPSETTIKEVSYKYEKGTGLVATDGKHFSLDINEFGSKS